MPSIAWLIAIVFLLPKTFAWAQGQTDSVATEKIRLKVGGALRFNYNLSTWKDAQVKRGGDFGYDVFRINTIEAFQKVSLNAEYRFYSDAFGGGMLKQGWIGYDINPESTLQIGLTQVPFGNTQYNSNS